MKRLISILAVLCIGGALCGCNAAKPDTGTEPDLSSMPEVTVPDIQIPSYSAPEIEVTKPNIDIPDMEVPTFEGFGDEAADAGDATIAADAETTAAAAADSNTITDESGSFTYTGALRQIGDDEHGYIKVPADFVNFQDVGVDNLVQASDKSGKNIITIAHRTGADYRTLADGMRAGLENQSDTENITGATVSPNGYEALQVYCHYKSDNMFLVTWAIKDPADEKSSYYMSIEFDNAHQNIRACSSTFQTREDYQKENG